MDIEIRKDGKFLKTIKVNSETLYILIDDEGYGEHALEILVPSSGLSVFTFTFG